MFFSFWLTSLSLTVSRHMQISSKHIFYDHYWTVYQLNYLSLFHRFYLVSSFGTYSSIHSFYLSLFVGFYIIDKINTPLSLEGVALCRDEPYCSAHLQLFIVSPSFVTVHTAYLFSVVPSSWVCVKTHPCFEGAYVSQHLDSGRIGSQTFRQQVLKHADIYSPLEL